MKKIVSLAVATLLMFLVFAISGCGSSATDETGQQAQQGEQKPERCSLQLMVKILYGKVLYPRMDGPLTLTMFTLISPTLPLINLNLPMTRMWAVK